MKPVTLPLAAISPDRRKDVIRAQRDASKEALARAEVALDRLEQTSKDAEKIELARLDVGLGPCTAHLPDRGRAGRVARRPGSERLEGVDRGRQGGHDGPARSGGCPGPPDRARPRVKRGDGPSRASGRRPTRLTPMPSRPWSLPRQAVRQPASDELHPPAADDISGDQHGPPARPGSLDHRPVATH